jgi:hypothetical protein
MHKLLLSLTIIGIALSSLSACAQSTHLDNFYRKYQSSSADDGDKGSGTISLDPSFMLNACFSGEANNASKGWMHKITNIRLLFVDGKKAPSARQEWSELEQSLSQDKFEELFVVRKGSDRMRLLSKDRSADLKEVAFLVVGKEGSGMFFHFRGHFTSKDLESLQLDLQSHDSQ